MKLSMRKDIKKEIFYNKNSSAINFSVIKIINDELFIINELFYSEEIFINVKHFYEKSNR